MSRAPLLASLACAVLPVLLAACASLSSGARVLDVPSTVQEERHGCGVAALVSLAAYHGRPLDEDVRRRLSDLAAEQRGLGGAELSAALQDEGFETYLFRGAFDRSPLGLLRHVDAGRPLLVGLAVDDEQHHFVLFTGYDEATRRVVLVDPSVHGRLLVDEERFIDAWQRAERFTLLAVPRPTATPPGETR